MNNLQSIKNQWYLERIRQKGLRPGDEILICPFNERTQKLRLLRKSYQFSHQIREEKPWRIDLPKIMEKEFNLELKLLSDGKEEEGRYFLLSHCKTPFKINGNFCYQSFVERGDEIEFGLHQIQTKSDIKVQDDLTIPSSVIRSDLPILIEGETGTGKTHLVKKIHELSGQTGRLVHLNLSSFSTSLFESELFGHVKGAFTGADRNKNGAIVEANLGTLFIDEMDSLTKELQVKLLLFLDDGRVRPVGGNSCKKVNTRLIAASGRSLQDLLEKGEIRKDFFFRIQSSYKINLKPLRQKKEQIQRICEKFSQDENISLSPQLLDFYQKCPWPGNIRQLIGHLRTKKVLSPGRKFEIDHFDYSLQKPLEIETKNKKGNFLDLGSVKKSYARQVFESSGRDVQLGAKILKISPTTLRGYIEGAMTGCS
ncbi:MAG: sigma 54-interacting transcriptional regulator [Bacteriovoracales bacterium]|nr:sigma 54-interacting transcriptional regulator [Bacteriovoracales bacterium]